MARVCPLFSGSRGNSTYVGGSQGGVLIDAGVSAKQLCNALLQRQIDIESIQGIFVTHEHGDHVSGVRVFASRHHIPVFGSCGTIGAMRDYGCVNDGMKANCIDSLGVQIAGMMVMPFPTSHDCRESTGYVLCLPDERKVAVCTDLGYVSEEVRSALVGCDYILIESNHDVRMLQNGPYAYPLKRRILGQNGHLSNDSCAKELPDLVKSGTTRIVLGHISQENNYPDLAVQTARAALTQAGLEEGKDYLLSAALQTGGQMTVF